MKAIDISGQRFGRLVAARRNVDVKPGRIMWDCVCDCGNSVSVASYSLRSGNTSSCGCLQLEKVTKHGHSGARKNTPTYDTWKGMKNRCTNPNNLKYHLYGGRGITVCDRWLSFDNFLADMGERPPNKSIDRIDGNKGYFPDNCKWATIHEQNSHLSSARYFLYKGKELSISDISKMTGIGHHSVDTRIRLGWSIDRIIETPLKTSKRWHDV